MICKKCNEQIPDNANFCTNCGEKVEKEEKKVEIEQVKESIQEEPKKIEEEKKKKVSGTSITVLVLSLTNLVAFVVTLILSLFVSAVEADESVGGWIIIMMPIIIALFSIPFLVESIISLISIFVRKNFMNIINLVFSVITILATIFSIKEKMTMVFPAFISILIGIAITIILIIKSIRKDI